MITSLKILVIGGTGMFGSRLCDLLARDGHAVTIASRTPASPKTERTKQSKGGMGFVQNSQSAPDLADFPHMVFDRNGPLTGFDPFDVIVDAAGPFHAYGDDPYRIARAAIAAGAHYFDLCDNAEFCIGISGLEGLAKAACVTVASGMSSVPAISSAAVDALCAGQTPLSIETAILPGNKAPRGRAVVESILDQVGCFYVEKQAGRDVRVRSWSAPRTYDLGPYKRQGWRIEVPDQRLFPDHFNCPTVTFRAGLELGIMRYGLGIFSILRNRLRFGSPRWLIAVTHRAAQVLTPFGTARGGMVVQVVIAQGTDFVRKRWIMRAENSDGPYTPAIAIRAACRNIDALNSGAAPALSLISLDKIELGFTDLDIETEITSQPMVPIFRQVLGTDFDTLPSAVWDTHNAVTPRVFKGASSVTRGQGILARVAAFLFGFPPSTDKVAVEVTKIPHGNGEMWERRFGARIFRSHLRPGQGAMTERFGPLTFELNLQVQGDKLSFPVRRGRIGLVPIPHFLLPQSIATEAEVDGIFHFDVLLKAPTGALLVHYKGWLKEG